MTDGFAYVDKVAGLTSHDVVSRARRQFETRKVGHAGTLDPDATGVLVLGIGRATRLLRFWTGLDKAYDAEIVLGVETDTLDSSGSVTATHEMRAVDPADVTAAAGRLTGRIDQVPPMVSAIKVDGRRLHELAREGVEIEREPRRVEVTRFDVYPADGDPTRWRAVVECSSGTYVRSLAADLGRLLGGGAHLASLRRTRVGPVTIDAAQPLEDAAVHPMASGLGHLDAVALDSAVARLAVHGRVLDRGRVAAEHQADLSGPGPWAMLDGDGGLVAVYERHAGDTIKPVVVVGRVGDVDE